MAIDLHARGPLPCGVLVEDLIAQVTDGAAPFDRAHQAACRYCQAALEAIREAWADFQRLARAAVTAPEDLAERVVRRIRQLAPAAPGRRTVISSARGETRVADEVLKTYARTAVASVPGVTWCSITSAGEDGAFPGALRVVVRLATVHGPAMQTLVEAVRGSVVRSLEAQTGAPVARVDIEVADVAVTRPDGPEPPPRAPEDAVGR